MVQTLIFQSLCLPLKHQTLTAGREDVSLSGSSSGYGTPQD